MRSQEEALARVGRLVSRAAEACSAHGMELVAAFLVGSRARGDYTVESDADVVLVIRGVEGLNMLDRLRLFMDVLEPNVDLLILSPDEWCGDSPWAAVLRREAMQLAGRDPCPR